MTAYSKENLKHLFGAIKNFQDGVKQTSRRSCDEIGLKLSKRRFHQNPK